MPGRALRRKRLAKNAACAEDSPTAGWPSNYISSPFALDCGPRATQMLSSRPTSYACSSYGQKRF